MVSKDTVGFFIASNLKPRRREASAGEHQEGGDMPRICAKCGGLVIMELAMDFYRARYWKCVNCGWSCKETLVRMGRAILSMPQRKHR